MRVGGLRTNYIVQKDYNKEKRLHKEFIMDVNIPYDKNLDNSTGHSIKVQFDHVEGSWKRNWLIDGIILEKINK